MYDSITIVDIMHVLYLLVYFRYNNRKKNGGRRNERDRNQIDRFIAHHTTEKRPRPPQ